MKKALLPAVSAAALLLATAAPGAGFEGVIDTKITSSSSAKGDLSPSGTGRMWLSSSGARVEITMDLSAAYAKSAKRDPDTARQMPKGGKTTMTILWKASTPTKTYMVNDASRSYSVLDMSEKRAAQKLEKEYAVKRLGRDTVGGFACTNYAISSPDGVNIDLCVAPELKTSGGWWQTMRGREKSQSGMAEAMRKVGEEGFPVRQVVKDKAGKTTMVTEVVAAKRQSVPTSTFDVPAGYRESRLGAAGVMMSPEQRKAMEEQMKRMTPEQRRQMEQMMKGNKEN